MVLVAVGRGAGDLVDLREPTDLLFKSDGVWKRPVFFFEKKKKKSLRCPVHVCVRVPVGVFEAGLEEQRRYCAQDAARSWGAPGVA